MSTNTGGNIQFINMQIEEDVLTRL